VPNAFAFSFISLRIVYKLYSENSSKMSRTRFMYALNLGCLDWYMPFTWFITRSEVSMHRYPLCAQIFQKSHTQDECLILRHIICTIENEFVREACCAYLGRTYPYTGPCSFLDNDPVETHVPHFFIHMVPRVFTLCFSSQGFILDSHDDRRLFLLKDHVIVKYG
jgi:hypothetical protein